MKALMKASMVRKIAVQTINCALAAVIAAPAVADVSPRKQVDPKGAFAKLTGQIEQVGATNGAYGNAFIVGADGCHVLTNFHVAFGKSVDAKTGQIELVDDVNVGHTVNFSFDLDSKTGKFKRSLKAKVVEFGNYEADTSRGFLGDIALLRLENCVGKEYGNLEIDRPASEKRVASGRLMTVSASRNTSGKNEILVEEGCRADSATSVTGMMLSNCIGVPGMSGSMQLEEGSDKKWRLAGLTTNLSSYADGTPVTKSIYAKVINKFLDSALGEAPLAIAPIADDRKPQSEQTARAETRTVVR